MTVMRFVRCSLATLIVLGVHGPQAASVAGTGAGGTADTDRIQPINSGPNPYRVIRDWAHIDGRRWGGSNGVAIDRDARTVWATDRCSPGTAPGCLGTSANPVHHFDESGKESRPSAVECSSGRTASTSIATGTSGVTDARAPGADDLSSIPAKPTRGASSSSSVLNGKGNC